MTEPMTQGKFLDYHGHICPGCHGTAGIYEIGGSSGLLYTCVDCSARWRQLKAPAPLIGYELLESPDDD